MIVVNITFTIICAFILAYLGRLSRNTSLNQQRFKLYKLRDDLAVLAMQGKMNPKCEEFTFLLTVINSSIKQLGNFSIVTYLKFLASSFRKDEKLSSIIHRMESIELGEYQFILAEFKSITSYIFFKQTRLFRFTLLPVIKIGAKIYHANNALSRVLLSRVQTVEEISSTFKDDWAHA